MKEFQLVYNLQFKTPKISNNPVLEALKENDSFICILFNVCIKWPIGVMKEDFY